MGKLLCQLFIYTAMACFTQWTFVKSVNAISTTRPDTCTDCCSFLACMGYNSDSDVYQQNETVFTKQFFNNLCSDINIVIIPTCLTKTNVEKCSYISKFVPLLPSQDTAAEQFAQFCLQRNILEEIQNISSCVKSSGYNSELVQRCSIPYFNGIKDPDSDLCEIMTAMSNCMVGILKVTNCSERYVTVYERFQNQTVSKPFCTKDTSNAGSLVIVDFRILLITLSIINIILAFLRCY